MAGKRRLILVVKMGDLRVVSHSWLKRRVVRPAPANFDLSSSQPTRANYSMDSLSHLAPCTLSPVISITCLITSLTLHQEARRGKSLLLLACGRHPNGA